jgi:hypothetical protein
VHVDGLEAGFGEGVGHLDVRVDALLAQDGDAGGRFGAAESCLAPSPLRGEGWGEAQVDMQAGIVHITRRRMLAVRARRVVALLADLPADAVPHLVQVEPAWR